MKAYGGSGCIDSHIFLRWVVSFMPMPLKPGERAPLLIGYGAGWAPEPVWTKWRRENSFPHRYSNSDPSVVQPVASRHTDYAILVHNYNVVVTLKLLLFCINIIKFNIVIFNVLHLLILLCITPRQHCVDQLTTNVKRAEMPCRIPGEACRISIVPTYGSNCTRKQSMGHSALEEIMQEL
jgi:hypothetical protein